MFSQLERSMVVSNLSAYGEPGGGLVLMGPEAFTGLALLCKKKGCKITIAK